MEVPPNQPLISRPPFLSLSPSPSPSPLSPLPPPLPLSLPPPPFQGRSHTFEHNEAGVTMVGHHTSSAGSLNSAGALQSPSHLSSLPPYSLHDGSMSSSQSISSSNSGRHSEGMQEEYDETGGASSLIPRAPTLDGNPFIRPRRGRSYTLPAGSKLKRPTHASSPSFQPERTDELMSLEDFLAESDKTPNRVSIFCTRVCSSNSGVILPARSGVILPAWMRD